MSKHPNNGQQKGKRRQKLHNTQNNVGDTKNEPKYKNFKGEPIEE